MTGRLVLSLIFLFLSTSFLYPQEPDNSRAKLYHDLVNAEISIINQKKAIKLKDYEDKVIVVLFLASWSAPCHQQAEYLKELQTEFQKEKLFTIGVNLDRDDIEAFKVFLRKNKFNYLMGFASEDLFKSLYAVSKKDAVPQTVVIHQGEVKVVSVGSGGAGKIVGKVLRDIFTKN